VLRKEIQREALNGRRGRKLATVTRRGDTEESTGTQKTEAAHGDQKRRTRGNSIGTQRTEAGHGDQKGDQEWNP